MLALRLARPGGAGGHQPAAGTRRDPRGRGHPRGRRPRAPARARALGGRPLAALRRGAPGGRAPAHPQSRHGGGQYRPRRSGLGAARAAALPRGRRGRARAPGRAHDPGRPVLPRPADHRARRPTSWPPRCASRCRRRAPGWGFAEVSRRHGDFALVGAVAVLARAADGTVSRARLAFFGAGGTPVRGAAAERALEGRAPTPALIAEAARAAAAGALARRRHPRHRGVPAAGGGHAGRAHADRGARAVRRGRVVTSDDPGDRERPGARARGRGARDPGRFPPGRPRPDRHPRGLRARGVRGVHGAARRRAGARLPDAGGAGRRSRGLDHRGRRPRRRAPSDPGGLLGQARAAVRLLHPWYHHERLRVSPRAARAVARGDPRDAGRAPLPLHRLPLHRRGHRGGRSGA